jgi:hypothetical protein
MSLSVAVVASFPTYLRGNHDIDSILFTDHHIPHDSIPVVVQTVQDHKFANAPSTPDTQSRLHALNQIHPKGLMKFSPLNLFFKIFFWISEKFESNDSLYLSPSTATAAPTIEADDGDHDDDDGECKAKPVPKEPPVDPPTSDDASQKLNLKPTTAVTGVAILGLSFYPTPSVLFTSHFLFL